MSASNQIMTIQDTNGALLEKVITSNDLGGLSPVEKVQHIRNVCSSLGLNPLTKPIQLIKFQGKEVMYMTRDAADQLRKNNHVSISNLETKVLDGIYIVTAHATTPEGRTDASTGAITIKGLQGDALCNAMMKCESKAKRRVTLSICGLGITDESELDTMQGHKKINIEMYKQASEHQKQLPQEVNIIDLETEFNVCMIDIKNADSLEKLQDIFKEIKKINFKDKPEFLKTLIDEKDNKKMELMAAKMDNINIETGEVN